MKQNNFLKIILIVLALHLLYSNAMLLRFLVGQGWFNLIFALLFALSYSLITVLIIAVLPRWYVFSFSALLDGIAVFLKYFPFLDDKTFHVLTAIYFATYTAYIVFISGLIARSTDSTPQKHNGNLNVKLLEEERLKLKRSLARLTNEEKRKQKEARLKEINAILETIAQN